MIIFIIIAVFLLTVAITSGSIVIASQLRIAYKSELFATLIYFLAFFFTFGFYALWGQIIASSFLLPFATQELIAKITDILILLGSPFLIFASLMFVRFSGELSGRKLQVRFVAWYIVFHFLFIAGLGLLLIKNPDLNVSKIIRYYFIVLSFLYTSCGIYFAMAPRKKHTEFEAGEIRKFMFSLFVLMLLHNTVLLFYDSSRLISLLFIFSYFIYGGFISIFIRYRVNLSAFYTNKEITASLEEFCKKYTITPREKEIVSEICNGLTNQQIADKLFISLQTVKDHTHRIYNKTECGNRARLIRLVNDENVNVSAVNFPVE